MLDVGNRGADGRVYGESRALLSLIFDGDWRLPISCRRLVKSERWFFRSWGRVLVFIAAELGSRSSSPPQRESPCRSEVDCRGLITTVAPDCDAPDQARQE